MNRAGIGPKDTGQSAQGSSAAGWRESKWLALCELAIVALIFIADWRHLIPFSKTPFILLVGWISLRLRKVGWRTVGFARYRSWTITVAIGIVCGVLMEAFQLLATQPLLARLTGKQPDLSDFRMLTGNLKLTLAGLALAWTLAAFGEELVYRGYLMNRIADLGNRTRLAWICSVLGVNAAFGFSHWYQGVTGQVEEGIAGLLLALLYLRTGHNLSAPIIAHGVADTIDLLLIFWGKFHGM